MGESEFLAGCAMRKKLKYGDRYIMVDVLNSSPLRVQISEGEESREIVLDHALTSGSGRFRHGDQYTSYFVTESPTEVWVTLAGETFCFEKSKGPAGGEDDHHGGFTAPMPGKVIKVPVKVGDTVEKGQVLVVMEAMKMEHRIEAPADGVVTALHCQQDMLVEQDYRLLEFEAET